ncbi:protein DCL homolog, chloroplastic-like [Pistacia vera]|uniref:protein DCL homolog, chloroplastic-like n=1 Tax=Pistacia vera TaxID=55513 RepID=UPI001263D457|nr:protein DCL homolog, chloroplastic-like [Pistacia vera]
MTMASISRPSPFLYRHSNPTSLNSSPVVLSFPFYRTTSLHLRVSALNSDGHKIGSQESLGSGLLRKPVISPSRKDLGRNSEDDEVSEEESEEEKEWVDWEDKILQDTVPLVSFVRMILHSGKYESGSRLSPEHERTILDKLLPYHPEFQKKIGSGIDYITIGYHPDFEGSHCLFIVRKMENC